MVKFAFLNLTALSLSPNDCIKQNGSESWSLLPVTKKKRGVVVIYKYIGYIEYIYAYFIYMYVIF